MLCWLSKKNSRGGLCQISSGGNGLKHLEGMHGDAPAVKDLIQSRTDARAKLAIKRAGREKAQSVLGFNAARPFDADAQVMLNEKLLRFVVYGVCAPPLSIVHDPAFVDIVDFFAQYIAVKPDGVHVGKDAVMTTLLCAYTT